MDAYLIEEHSSSLIRETPLAVAAAAAWLGLGFVMVVAVACWARGAPARPRWSAVCSTPVIAGICMPCGTINDYQFGIWFT
jgi:hypothetical protein